MSDTIRALALDYLQVDVPAVIFADTDFTMTVTAKDGDGDTDAAYDAVSVSLLATDANDNVLTLAFPALTLTNGTVTITNQQFSSVGFVAGPIDIIATSTITDQDVHGTSIGRIYFPRGKDQAESGVLTLVYTAEPTTVTRGVNFTLTLETQDGFGNKVANTVTADLTLQGAGPLDVLNTTTANIVGGDWTDATMQVTGDDGAEAGVDIAADATDYDGTVTLPFSIATPLPATLQSTTADLVACTGPDAGSWNDFTYFNGVATLTYDLGTDAYYDNKGNWDNIADDREAIRLKIVSGNWEVTYRRGKFGGYGTSKVTEVVFRAMTSEADPRLAAFAYDRLDLNAYAGDISYSGAGSVSIGDVP